MTNCRNMTASFLDGFSLPAVPFLGMKRRLPAIPGLLFLLVHGLAPAGDFGTQRVMLDHRVYDVRDPAKADFLDCPDGRGACQAVGIPRVMADEKIILPRNKPLESLRFLSLKGIRVQGGDPLLTLALFGAPSGDSVFMDMNNDEDLGNDGPARFWPKGDSCVSLERVGGGAPPVALCRSGAKAKAWQNRCEAMKSSVTWALCNEAPYQVRILDLSTGTLSHGGVNRRIALCDADGDGRIRLDAGDRLVIDWDGDGTLEKSLEADGLTAPPGGAPFRFSLDSTSYEVASVDDRGGWIDLRRLYAFDPGAAAFKAVEGRKAPDLRFINLDGDTVRLSDFKGKKVLVHFWSTLCKPCLEDMSGIREFHKVFGAKNWQIISLTTDTDLGEVQQAALKYHMDWMVGMAGPDARRYYSTRPLPVSVKINEQGILEKKDLVLGKRAF
ncbi:MAG: putative Thiol-disulfide oxidoreductase ResA [Fibrobacteres bacterium]|nr:putative Thiol-disulfide oxidoreductase ResA [Fibrobacterota bacterium]